MILLFSGPAGVGKSTICQLLQEEHNFVPIKSSEYLKELAHLEDRAINREALQEIGDRLDLQTDYSWLLDAVAIPQMTARPTQSQWYVDSVRKPKQVQLFRKNYSDDVVHIHVTASETTLRKRFEMRRRDDPTNEYEKDYGQHILHPNEIASRNLGKIADLVIDCTRISPAESCERILEFAGKQ